MKTTILTWSVSGDYDCPYCGHLHDFLDQDEFWEHCNVAEQKDMNYTKICDNCGEEFLINESIY